MIILLVSGIYTYDQYKVGQGEPSPIGKFIDYAGLAKYIDMAKREKKVETATEYFHFNSKESLEKLLYLQSQLREKRKELIAQRKAILQKLYDINNQTLRETNVYIGLLEKERDRILRSLPQIKAYGKSLASSFENRNVLQTEQYFKAVKEEVMNVFKEVTDNPEQNIPSVVNTLNGLEKIIHQTEGSLQDYCADISSKDLSTEAVVSRCIKKRVLDLQEDINMYAKVIKGPEDSFNKIKELTGVLDYEVQLLKTNSEATESRLQKGSEDVSEGLRYLVQELVEITDQEMHNFLELYSAFQKEQEALLNNLASNHRRFISSYKMNDPRIQRILEALNTTSRFDFSSILNKYRQWQEERESLMKQFTENERDLFISTNTRRKGNREFVTNLLKKFENVKKK